jgi:hypothetical protein
MYDSDDPVASLDSVRGRAGTSNLLDGTYEIAPYGRTDGTDIIEMQDVRGVLVHQLSRCT